MPNVSFPRWAAPFVTSALCATSAYWVMLRDRQHLPFSWSWIGGGAVIGFFVGLLIALADRPSKKAPAPRVVWKPGIGPTVVAPPESEFEPEPAQQSIIGPFLSLLAILLFWAPIVGFFVSLFAFVGCRNRHGWPKILSVVAFCLSLLVMLALLVLFAFAPRS